MTATPAFASLLTGTTTISLILPSTDRYVISHIFPGLFLTQLIMAKMKDPKSLYANRQRNTESEIGSSSPPGLIVHCKSLFQGKITRDISFSTRPTSSVETRPWLSIDKRRWMPKLTQLLLSDIVLCANSCSVRLERNIESKLRALITPRVAIRTRQDVEMKHLQVRTIAP